MSMEKERMKNVIFILEKLPKNVWQNLVHMRAPMKKRKTANSCDKMQKNTCNFYDDLV